MKGFLQIKAEYRRESAEHDAKPCAIENDEHEHGRGRENDDDA